MSRSNSAAEKDEYERVRSEPLTKINGRPEWSDYTLLKKELSSIAANSETQYWWGEDGAGIQYGLLADILGGVEYELLTGIDSQGRKAYSPTMRKPNLVDETITNVTSDAERERKNLERAELIKYWHMRRGLHRGLGENIREALDAMYYSGLKHEITSYKTIKPIDYLKHLKTDWVIMDTAALKQIKKDFYVEWDGESNLKNYSTDLTRTQAELRADNIIINDADKLQWYIEQMYECQRFEKMEMTTWEAKPSNQKTWTDATSYFIELVRIQDQYERMSSRTTKRSRYESAAHAAEVGDELRGYIESVASKEAQREQEVEERIEQLNKMQSNSTDVALLVTKLSEKIDKKDDQIQKLTTQMAELQKAIKELTSNQATKQAGSTKEPIAEKTKRTRITLKKGQGAKWANAKRGPRCIGGYCWSHGFDPPGSWHNSKTCMHIDEGHQNGATATNRMGGSMFQAEKELYTHNQQDKYVKRN